MVKKILTMTSLIALLSVAACNVLPGTSNAANMSLQPLQAIATPETLTQSANFRDA